MGAFSLIVVINLLNSFQIIVSNQDLCLIIS